jgi:hypothetical protein
MYNQLDFIESKIKDSQFTQKMINQKLEGHYRLIKKHNRKILWYTNFETFIEVIILIIQMCYLKRLVNK